MTKKDFVLIAAVLVELDMPRRARLGITRDFRDVLERENPRFKPGVFMKAAGFSHYEEQFSNVK